MSERFTIPIRHPDWLERSHPEKTLALYRAGTLPKSIAGWMIVVACKQPLRAVYGSDLAAGWYIFWGAVQDGVRFRWMEFRMKHLGWRPDEELGLEDEP